MTAVDLFACEYGWTVADVERLTVAQYNGLLQIIDKRQRKLKRDRKKLGQ